LPLSAFAAGGELSLWLSAACASGDSGFRCTTLQHDAKPLVPLYALIQLSAKAVLIDLDSKGGVLEYLKKRLLKNQLFQACPPLLQLVSEVFDVCFLNEVSMLW